MPKVVPFPKIYRTGAPRTMADELLVALWGLPELASGGYQVQRAGITKFVIARNEHVLGIWRILDGSYIYTPPSHRQPTFESGDVAEAIGHLRELLRPADRALRIERRRDDRWPVQCSTMLCMTNHQTNVVIEDVSVGGLRIRTASDLSVSGPLTVELHSHDRQEATIAWIRCGRVGAMWRHPLSPSHEFLALARRGAAV